ncbi:hypothetical protein Droror1_Dr00012248 [Drosera rotundifolia]
MFGENIVEKNDEFVQTFSTESQYIWSIASSGERLYENASAMRSADYRGVKGSFQGFQFSHSCTRCLSSLDSSSVSNRISNQVDTIKEALSTGKAPNNWDYGNVREMHTELVTHSGNRMRNWMNSVQLFTESEMLD